MNTVISHPNVVIHVDIDYFYAQVEEVMNPELKDKPFGVQQGVNIVTCNYIARSFGVKKWRTLKECLEKCPQLVCVKGEDLSNYKIYSKRISELVHSMIGPSERMGLDEHYIDITKQIEEEMSEMMKDELNNLRMTGPIYPDEAAFNECNCGCEQRLIVGSQIAQKLREKILQDLKLTCSVGIAHNKLLAKLVGQLNKPNNQTVLAPTSASEFMKHLKEIRSIHGIGGKTASKIEELGIHSIADLQNCDMDKLRKVFGGDMPLKLKELSMGYDISEVKPSGKPKTVGLEDSCRPISLRSDAEEMFNDLLPRLVAQIQDDERYPQSIKVTLRKYDIAKKISVRETKQCFISPSHFRFNEKRIDLAEGAQEKIMKDVMGLFDRMVDIKHQFYINLVGLCFGKFQDQKKGPASITSFLVKRENMEVSSTSSLDHGNNIRSTTTSFFPAKKSDSLMTNFLTKRLEYKRPSDDVQHKEETEFDSEPSSKKLKIENITATSLPVLPSSVDPEVWKELPIDVQRELVRNWIPPAIEARSSSVEITSHLKTKQARRKGTGDHTLHNHLI